MTRAPTPSSVPLLPLCLRRIVEDHRLCYLRSQTQRSLQTDPVYRSWGFLIDDLGRDHLDHGLGHFVDIRRLCCVIVLESRIVCYDEDFEIVSVS